MIILNVFLPWVIIRNNIVKIFKSFELLYMKTSGEKFTTNVAFPFVE